MSVNSPTCANSQLLPTLLSLLTTHFILIHPYIYTHAHTYIYRPQSIIDALMRFNYENLIQLFGYKLLAFCHFQYNYRLHTTNTCVCTCVCMCVANKLSIVVNIIAGICLEAPLCFHTINALLRCEIYFQSKRMINAFSWIIAWICFATLAVKALLSSVCHKFQWFC